MNRRPQVDLLGRRLHLQDGPIDLIIEADGRVDVVRRSYQAAVARFTGLLDELCAELEGLRRAAGPWECQFESVVARRMYAAVAPYAQGEFITPMAAVAGSVAEEILAAMLEAAPLDRAYVNNGGDIALHLALGERFTVGLIDRPDGVGTLRFLTVRADDETRGIATSGRHGRSFSLGIADGVTVLARTAAQADAAATVIGNAVDLPGHPAIKRQAAHEIQPDSDLGALLVTREVGELSCPEVRQALECGAERARHLLEAGRIEAAVLQLSDDMVVVGACRIEQNAPRGAVKGREIAANV